MLIGSGQTVLVCCTHLFLQGAVWVFGPSWTPRSRTTHLLLISANCFRQYLRPWWSVGPRWIVVLTSTFLDPRLSSLDPTWISKSVNEARRGFWTECVLYHELSEEECECVSPPALDLPLESLEATPHICCICVHISPAAVNKSFSACTALNATFELLFLLLLVSHFV